jgi:hypothetical protein
MSLLPQALLSAALRVKWEHGHAEDARACALIALRVLGFAAEEYAEASRRAAALDREAWRLAEAWHGREGAAWPSARRLERLCPGFAPGDYAEAIRKNVLWARK